MYFKKITGQQCYLSPVDLDDSEKYASWVAGPEVAMGLGVVSGVMSVETEREFLQKYEGYCFAVVDIHTDELLGNCSIFAVDWPNRRGKVGLFIGDEKQRGKGLGSEVLHLLLDFAFFGLNLHSVSLTAFSYNHRAIRCYEKVGFKEVGRMREARIVGDKKYDEILMDFLSSEFHGSSLADIAKNMQLSKED